MSEWRALDKVCKPKHGQANTKSYRYVSVWQPPKTAHGGWPGAGYCALGRVVYAGPMRSTYYMDHGKFHILRGSYLVAWWHEATS